MTDDRHDETQGTPNWQLPQERQPESDAYHIWTPRPLLRSIYWKPDPAPPYETVSATYEIFVDQRAWLTMHEHVWQTDAERTPFGYLIGDLCEDPNVNRRFVTITAALPARFEFREEASDQISREATLALQLEVERRRGVLAGWYHRHVGGEVAMADPDVKTHLRHFSDPWQCAFLFVGGGDRCEGGCFRAMPDRFDGRLQLPFYEMASNESLLARGTKRSYMDWSNYATVDEIRLEPPQRPSLDLPSPPPEDPRPDEPPTDGTDEKRLVVHPFDIDPEGTEPEAPDPEVEEESEGAGAEMEPSPAEQEPPPGEAEAEAPDPDAERETEVSAPSDEEHDAGDEAAVDLESAIDSVRPARIEMDPGAGEPAAPEAPEPAAAREAERRTTSASAPSIKFAPPDRKRMIVAGSLTMVLVLAAAAVVYLFLTGEIGPGAEAADDGPAADPAGQPAATDLEEGMTRPAGVTLAQIDSVGRGVQTVISRFYGRALAQESGTGTCEELAAAFVSVEDAWIDYNTDYRAELDEPLTGRLAERDEQLYAGVQEAERMFDQSGCERP